MEALDGLVQRLVEVRQQGLKASYANTSLICQLGRVGTVVAQRVGNEEAHGPEVALILHVETAVACGYHRERLAQRIRNLRLDVRRHGHDVVHHAGHVGKDLMVLALKDIVGGVARGAHDKGVVDEALAQRLHRGDLTLKGKTLGNG